MAQGLSKRVDAENLGTDLVMVPEPVDQRPAMARSTDVLPTPLGPITSRDSPSFTWNQRHALLFYFRFDVFI